MNVPWRVPDCTNQLQPLDILANGRLLVEPLVQRLRGAVIIQPQRIIRIPFLDAVVERGVPDLCIEGCRLPVDQDVLDILDDGSLLGVCGLGP